MLMKIFPHCYAAVQCVGELTCVAMLINTTQLNASSSASMVDGAARYNAASHPSNMLASGMNYKNSVLFQLIKHISISM